MKNVLMILDKPFTHEPYIFKEGASLLKAGYKVTVLARDKENKYPLSETKEGMEVRRVYNTKYMSRLPYNLFDLNFWEFEGYKKALDLYKKNPFTIVHCHDFATLNIGVRLKKKLDVKLIYDAHEIWGYMVAGSIPWWKYYLNKEKRLLKFVDKFIIAEDKYEEYYNPITDKGMIPILNCKYIISKEYIPADNNFLTLIYIGTLASTRYLLEVVEVVKELNDVRLIICGYVGVNRYIEALKKKCNEAENIDFLGPVPADKVVPMTLDSDVVVCMIDPSAVNNKIATANKQFEAMVCGRPIICTKGTRSGEITEQEKCGIVIDYTKEALRKAIIKLRDDPKLCEELGKNALKAAINKYNWNIEEKKLLELYEKLDIIKN